MVYIDVQMYDYTHVGSQIKFSLIVMNCACKNAIVMIEG